MSRERLSGFFVSLRMTPGLEDALLFALERRDVELRVGTLMEARNEPGG